MTIHDVKVQPIRASGLDRLHLLPESPEISSEQAGRYGDLLRAGNHGVFLPSGANAAQGGNAAAAAATACVAADEHQKPGHDGCSAAASAADQPGGEKAIHTSKVRPQARMRA
jgi:hypothetical protein